jgi:hypothetical protein
LDDAGNIASPMKFSKAILAGRNGWFVVNIGIPCITSLWYCVS